MTQKQLRHNIITIINNIKPKENCSLSYSFDIHFETGNSFITLFVHIYINDVHKEMLYYDVIDSDNFVKIKQNLLKKLIELQVC